MLRATAVATKMLTVKTRPPQCAAGGLSNAIFDRTQ